MKPAPSAMRYLATPEVATAWLSAPVLLSETQFTTPPTHITVIGPKQDAATKALFDVALVAKPELHPSGVVGQNRRSPPSRRRRISGTLAPRRISLHGDRLLVANLRPAHPRNPITWNKSILTMTPSGFVCHFEEILHL